MNWRKGKPKLAERSRAVLAQGETGTNSKRPSAYVEGVYPSHLVKGKGCYVWDEEGNKYIDYVCGLGATLLGHAHPKVVEAVQRAVGNGTAFGLAHPLEVEVAEKITQTFPQCEKVRFFKNGDDATTAAIRIARAYTGTSKVISSGYHGRSDIWTSLTPPALGVKDWFDIGGETESVENRIAIVEPIRLENWEVAKKVAADLMGLSKCMIFDEIVTGGRVPKWSCGRWWETAPYLSCFGKGLAGGLPLSWVGGRKEVMDCGPYFLSSTFSGETTALAACQATLNELDTLRSEDLWFYGGRLRDRLNAILKEIHVHIEGYNTRGQFNTEEPNTALFWQESLKAGLFFGKAWFLTFAHLETGIEEATLSIVGDVVNRIRSGRVKLEGTPPQSTFKR